MTAAPRQTSEETPAGDTIVACSTAPGRSDRAVVRASGPAVSRLAALLLDPPPDGRGFGVTSALIGGRPCPAMAIRAVGPASYTGEDTLEVVLPGNPHLIERLLEGCCAVEGVRRAGPGEFSARSYLNGRLSLTEAEGVAALIAARSRDDLDGARRLASGELGRVYRGWADELTTLLALVEAGIDFVDQEDVVPIPARDLRARLERVRADMASRASGGIAAVSEGLEPLVALAGPPNAGKSTLFNALLGRARSVVADESGTTRDVLIESLRLDEAAGAGLAVRIADLPGLDARAPGAAARAAQAAAVETLRRADAVIACDPAGRFDVLDLEIGDEVPVLRVRTKADQPHLAAAGTQDVEVCALDGWHLDVLKRGIADIALRAPGGSCAVAFARHSRQITSASDALDALAREIDPLDPALESPELVADALRHALDALEQVLGRVTPDDVIGRVFATFCVGK
ncbi:MAG: tRNA modification GTPase [Phycisphaerales bacterium JB041]